jgi:hypothetical protein
MNWKKRGSWKVRDENPNIPETLVETVAPEEEEIGDTVIRLSLPLTTL